MLLVDARRMTEGRRMLLAVLRRTSAREVAARCRVHESVVSRWASGRQRPGPRAREALERWSGYRIPAAAWSVMGASR